MVDSRYRVPDGGPISPVARPRPASTGRRLAAAALAVAVAVGMVSALFVAIVISTTGAVPIGLTAGPPVVVRNAKDVATSPGPTAPDAAPVSEAPAPGLRATALDIPTLGVRGDLVELGVDAAGVLQPPESAFVAGWFTGGAAPGEPGPTVIAGHVDSKNSPGVFYRLKDLGPGDEVSVGRSDGRTARYRVTGVAVVDKDDFPTEQVYGPTSGPELRLITCGGDFDRASGHYLRNVVASAVLVDLT